MHLSLPWVMNHAAAHGLRVHSAAISDSSIFGRISLVTAFNLLLLILSFPPSSELLPQ